jgi:hypothetical protein
MKKEDFVIQSEVRRLLVRSNIDYSKIDYGTVKGVVYFRGFFRLPMAIESQKEAQRAITVKTLSSFEKKIRSIPGVVDVIFQFTNWLKEKGQWVPIRSMKIEERKGEGWGQKPESMKEKEGESNDESKTTLAIQENIKET